MYDNVALFTNNASFAFSATEAGPRRNAPAKSLDAGLDAGDDPEVFLGKRNRENKLCACCICAVHWRHLWGFFAQSPTSVLGKFTTWFSDVLKQHIVPGIQWCFGMTCNSLCQIISQNTKLLHRPLDLASHPIH